MTGEEQTRLDFGCESPGPVAAQQATTPGSAHSFPGVLQDVLLLAGTVILSVAGLLWVCAGNSLSRDGLVSAG